eukprot:TRINITY_DN3678_c0_g2_i2.p1 TRINITY_DN3678_c0_g2~~TRINITY_DN3678_c0_g2_i2.p1  ORF type:complete len:828 (+),score=221.76 TRINITY_DN3678_c0_g2_i2:104-2587(+)
MEGVQTVPTLSLNLSAVTPAPQLAPTPKKAEDRRRTLSRIDSYTRDLAENPGTPRVSHLLEKRLTASLNFSEEEKKTKTKDDVSSSYNPFTADIWTAYHKIIGFVRELNTHIEVPEIVLVGKRGHGKTTLLEAFLGHPILSKGKYCPSQRPLNLMMVHNPNCETPRITVIKDTVIKGSEFDHNIEVSISELPTEVQKRNIPSRKPIYIQYESCYCVNMTFVDTPGLSHTSEEDAASSSSSRFSRHPNNAPAGGRLNVTRKEDAELERLVIELSKTSIDQSRVIVCVEESGPRGWGSLEMLTWIRRKLDIKLERTLFAFTNFHAFLESIKSPDQYKTFASSRPATANSFFVTTPPLNNDISSSPEAYKEKVHSFKVEDQSLLKKISPSDQSILFNVGVFTLRRFLWGLAFSSYEDSVPLLLALQEDRKVETEANLELLELRRSLLTPYHLRATASILVTNFVNIIEGLLGGSLEGDPSVNGQTLSEEKADEGGLSWVDGEGRPIYVDPDWLRNVPYLDVRLYGGKQLERVLAEFKVVVEHLEPGSASKEEVATIAGISKNTQHIDYAWAASCIAQRSSQAILTTLINALHRRVVYAMKRVAQVAFNLLANKKFSPQTANVSFVTPESLGLAPNRKFEVPAANNSAVGEGLDPSTSAATTLSEHPFLSNSMIDAYDDFVDLLGYSFKNRCMEEFYPSELIAIELKNFEGLSEDFMKTLESKSPYDRVITLSKYLFDRIARRVVKQVTLKCYSMFFIPMKTGLRGEMHTRIMAMSDPELIEVFAVPKLQQKLTQEEDSLNKLVESFDEKEKQLKALFADLARYSSSGELI